MCASRVTVAPPNVATLAAERDSAISAVRFSFACAVAMRSSRAAISSCFADASVRVSQMALELAGKPKTANVRVSQMVIELATLSNGPPTPGTGWIVKEA